VIRGLISLRFCDSSRPLYKKGKGKRNLSGKTIVFDEAGN
jgi:hypothetical protein